MSNPWVGISRSSLVTFHLMMSETEVVVVQNKVTASEFLIHIVFLGILLVLGDVFLIKWNHFK